MNQEQDPSRNIEQAGFRPVDVTSSDLVLADWQASQDIDQAKAQGGSSEELEELKLRRDVSQIRVGWPDRAEYPVFVRQEDADLVRELIQKTDSDRQSEPDMNELTKFVTELRSDLATTARWSLVGIDPERLSDSDRVLIERKWLEAANSQAGADKAEAERDRRLDEISEIIAAQ